MQADPPATTHPIQTHARATAAGTARFITRSLCVASHEPRYAALLPVGSGSLCARLLTVAGDERFRRMATHGVFRAVFQTAVHFVLPGIIPHYLARKRCLEDWFRHACSPGAVNAGGCRQVIVFGAGLDTLAWRMSGEWPAVQFIEVDRPAALRVKEQAMAATGLPPNLTFLAADLVDATLAEALARCPSFDPALPSLFLAEGLLMYLSPERTRSLLAEAAALGAPGTPSLFAFTFMEGRADGRIGFRRTNPLVNWWLRWQGEPFRWSYSPAKLAGFLAQTGWHQRELVSGDTLRDRYLAPAGLRDVPLAMGEWLALAQTGSVP